MLEGPDNATILSDISGTPDFFVLCLAADYPFLAFSSAMDFSLDLILPS